MSNIRAIKKPTFLISNANKAFNHLRQMFIKVLIYSYFDLKYHIKIKTNASTYAISGMLSQLNLNYNKIILDDSNLIKFDFSQ